MSWRITYAGTNKLERTWRRLGIKP